MTNWISPILVLAALLPLPLMAADPQPATAPPTLSTPPTIGGGAVLETMLFLVLIIGLIIGLGWLVRRMGRLPTGGKGLVSVLGGVSLGPRERAVVVQAGDTRLLVGVAPGRVQTLCVLNGPESDEEQAEVKESGEFKAKLKAELEENKS
jgi:flagellar protein FliO/FliZ